MTTLVLGLLGVGLTAAALASRGPVKIYAGTRYDYSGYVEPAIDSSGVAAFIGGMFSSGQVTGLRWENRGDRTLVWFATTPAYDATIRTGEPLVTFADGSRFVITRVVKS